jgi:CRP-like cAMP-binding protein
MRDEGMIQLFRRLLRTPDPVARDAAAEAMRVVARPVERQRNQSCDALVAAGRIGCVLAGAVRKYSLRSDGHRQIVDLLMPGDFLGLSHRDPCFALEAVSNGTRIASFRPGQVEALAQAHTVIANLILDRTADAIRRLEAHLLVQGRTTAIEKVGGYLVTMCGRMADGRNGSLLLPISRYDIADHLGIAVETVSRTMTTLTQRGMIALPSPRHVEIRDPVRLAEGTSY